MECRNYIFSRFSTISKIPLKIECRKCAHVIKAVLSVILVAVIYTFIPGYFPSWKESGLASVLTVTAVLDLTIGATLNKCANNIGASIIGGCIGYGAFIIGGKLGSTGQIPFIASLVIIILIFSLVLKYTNVVSEQCDTGLSCLATAVATASLSTLSTRGLMTQLIKTKLMGLAIGVSACLTVSIVIPVFASAIVRKNMIEYLDKLATFYEGLEEVWGEKAEMENIEGQEFIKLPVEVVDDKEKYKSMLTNVTYEPHGRLFWFPLDQYTELGDICQIVAHYCCTLSYNLIDLSKDETLGLEWKQNTVLQKACLEMSSQSAKSLRSLAETMRTKTKLPARIIETLSTALNVASEINAKLIETQMSHIVSPLIKSVGVIEKLIGSVDELARVAGYHEPVKPDPVRVEILGEEEKKKQADHVAIDIDCVPVIPIVPSQPVSNHGPYNHVITVPSQCESGEKGMKGGHVVIDMSKLDPDPLAAAPSKPKPIKKLLIRLFSRFKTQLAKTYPLHLTEPIH